jgi:hypothetical protein
VPRYADGSLGGKLSRRMDRMECIRVAMVGDETQLEVHPGGQCINRMACTTAVDD